MKFQTSALLLLAASIDAFSPVSTPSRTSVALNAGEGLNVDLPSIESQVSFYIDLHKFRTDGIGRRYRNYSMTRRLIYLRSSFVAVLSAMIFVISRIVLTIY